MTSLSGQWTLVLMLWFEDQVGELAIWRLFVCGLLPS